MMNGPEKSDSVIVALKLTNKTERSAAELVERRTGTEGNVGQCSTYWTQCQITVSQLARIWQRFAVDTRGGTSRMRESRPYASGRGARGNSRPYREKDAILLRCMSPKLDPSQTLAAGKPNRDFDRRATLGGLFSALTGTNGSTNFKRQRDDNQGERRHVARSKRCLLSRRTLASRTDPRSGGAVIAAEYADASKSRGDRKKHLGLCSHW
jgi:hypothetical protein